MLALSTIKKDILELYRGLYGYMIFAEEFHQPLFAFYFEFLKSLSIYNPCAQDFPLSKPQAAHCLQHTFIFIVYLSTYRHKFTQLQLQFITELSTKFSAWVDQLVQEHPISDVAANISQDEFIKFLPQPALPKTSGGDRDSGIEIDSVLSLNNLLQHLLHYVEYEKKWYRCPNELSLVFAKHVLSLINDKDNANHVTKIILADARNINQQKLSYIYYQMQLYFAVIKPQVYFEKSFIKFMQQDFDDLGQHLDVDNFKQHILSSMLSVSRLPLGEDVGPKEDVRIKIMHKLARQSGYKWLPEQFLKSYEYKVFKEMLVKFTHEDKWQREAAAGVLEGAYAQLTQQNRAKIIVTQQKLDRNLLKEDPFVTYARWLIKLALSSALVPVKDISVAQFVYDYQKMMAQECDPDMDAVVKQRWLDATIREALEAYHLFQYLRSKAEGFRGKPSLLDSSCARNANEFLQQLFPQAHHLCWQVI